MKSSFVEHMSYKFKKYGKQGIPYLNVLEEEVNKTGTTVTNLIKKEHFDIGIKKLTIGNCIRSIREISRINFAEIFENTSGIEELLNKDPSEVYRKMDYKTKEHYRNKIKELSKKTKLSEIYITQKLLECAHVGADDPVCPENATNKNELHINNQGGQGHPPLQNKKSHIGYYLISDGQKFFKNYLLNKTDIEQIKNIKPNQSRPRKYIWTIAISTLVVDILIASIFYRNIFIAILTGLLLLIPISEIIIQIIQYILSKTIQVKIIPKMNYINGIPEEMATFVVIPTILNKKEKVEELIKKLEVFYLANKSENMYFAVLGDCSSSTKKEEDYDTEIIETGIEKIQKLNEKYKYTDFPRFHFLYRNREWNNSENCYLGWERKRGLLNQFNNYLLENDNPFRTNTLEYYKEKESKELPNIKNIITLDSDTELVLNSGLELIGTMGHILNMPKLSEDRNVVEEGYGIIQPRIGIDIESSRKSIFTQIMAGYGGTDSYTNAISDIYQDTFGEAIFTGKGIYNLECFNTVFKNKIPENTVLSHDLLEGSYLKCGLASDILLLDGYPSKYNAYALRAHRWIRGDWQIISWLKNKTPLNKLSKYKIFDNLRRSLIEPSVLACLLVGVAWYATRAACHAAPTGNIISSNINAIYIRFNK